LISLHGTFSTQGNITCGVPRDPFSPLLFLIYVNDLSVVVKNKLFLYADDSAILVCGKRKDITESVRGTELETVSKWLICNKLSLHLGKTKSVFFGSKQRLSKTELNITCNGNSIVSEEYVKYLGAILDQSLSFEDMVTSIIKKANGKLKFLYRNRWYLTKPTKRLLVMSLVQCHFDYASSVWFYGITQQLKNKLQVTQNKRFRFILNLDPRSHVGHDSFSDLTWLPVANSNRVDFKTLGHVFKIHSKESTTSLMEHFKPVTSSHNHRTRFRVKVQDKQDDSFSFIDSGRFLFPKVEGFRKLSFALNGCSLWNDLPQNIRDVSFVHAFKATLRKHLMPRVPV